jgi:polyisoprenyl-phosphate glycosyltransferase
VNKEVSDKKLSVVIPAYKCEKCIGELYDRLSAALKDMGYYEIIFVNDCSPEKDWEVISEICAKDDRVKGINLSRNFGQHTAITAGLDAASGEWVVVMDCDLQDRPEEIPKLFAKAQEGYDIVYARRAARKDGFLKKMSSKLFYRVLSYLTDTEQDEAIANFGIYQKRAIEAVRAQRESMRYFPVMIRWVGFRSASIEVEHSSSAGRKSSYNFGRLFNLALDVMIGTSSKPLKLVVKLGMFISGASFVYALYLIFKALHGDYLIAGWPSMIVSIWFLSGMIILILGIVGLYVGKTFEEAKNKPLYIMKEWKNFENGKVND